MQPAELIAQLAAQGNRVAVAESLTGGLLLSELISIAGASNVVQGGIVCYSTESKIEVLGVAADTIAQYGVISEATAIAMAQQVAKKFKAEIGIATTGVAGPKRQEDKPTGTVFIAVAGAAGAVAIALALTGDRSQIRAQSVMAALELLGKYSGDLPSGQDVVGEI
jgi:nicotinamide-nucleotide amidase